MTNFLEQPSRYLFFTGKGGVGKTALACATAIRLAGAGKRILLVSTDPASNLDEMLGVPLSQRPTPVPGVDGLSALNIDPEKAADEYRERVIAPYRPIWSEGQVAELREQLAGACTVEIAAFDEFAELLAGDETTVPFDHVLFDTAPTGHTLRLLSLPRVWTGFLQSTTQGASCLGPHSGLKMQETRFAAAVEALGDGKRTTIVLVTRPDRAALREVDRSAGELEALGLKNQHLVVNAVFEATDRTDPVAMALERRGREALREVPARLQGLPTMQIPLRPFNMVGLPALRALLDDRAAASLARATAPPVVPSLPPLASLIDDIVAPGPWPGHGDGQGRSRQDDHRRGDRGGARVARPLRSPQHHRPGGAHRDDARGPARQLDHEPHRSDRRDEGVRGPRDGDSRGQSGRGGTNSARGRSPLALLRGGRRLRSLLPDRRPGPVELRRPGHCPDRAHAAPPRRHGLVSPADPCHRNGLRSARPLA